jgi:hypothetical protein
MLVGALEAATGAGAGEVVGCGPMIVGCAAGSDEGALLFTGFWEMSRLGEGLLLSIAFSTVSETGLSNGIRMRTLSSIGCSSILTGSFRSSTIRLSGGLA